MQLKSKVNGADVLKNVIKRENYSTKKVMVLNIIQETVLELKAEHATQINGVAQS